MAGASHAHATNPGHAAHGHADGGHGGSDYHDHGAMHYVKIWALLLVLLIISVAGPMLEIRVLTLITAFGIALVKAVIVAAYFMHLKIEKRFCSYLLYTMLLMVGLFFAAVMTDVLKPDGNNWRNQSAHDWIDWHKAHPEAAHGAHGAEAGGHEAGSKPAGAGEHK